MRLATILLPTGPAACVVQGSRFTAISGVSDVGALLRDPRWRKRAEAAAVGGRSAPFDEETTLLRPIPVPSAVVCVGQNYAAHIAEMGRQPPSAPTLFGKVVGALTDPEVPIEGCATSPALDYEGELVIVIGRPARNVRPANALDHVAGYTLMNDVSARDLQYRTSQFFAGKNLERSTPVGPWIVTPDELGELGARRLVTRVNGEVRQDALLSDLVFDVATLIADVSHLLTLQPGDLIATGTPGGVGHARDPKAYLMPGDLVEIEVDGLGVLRNPVG